MQIGFMWVCRFFKKILFNFFYVPIIYYSRTVVTSVKSLVNKKWIGTKDDVIKAITAFYHLCCMENHLLFWAVHLI